MSNSSKKTIRSPSQKRAQDTVKAILTATTRILDRDGFIAATTNHIADTAGVGIGSLYQYFKNKDQIIQALIQKMIDGKTESIRENLNQTNPKNLREGVSAVIQALLSSKLSSSRLERILESQVPKMGLAIQLLEKADILLIKMFKEFLEPYQDELSNDFEIAIYTVIQAIRGALVMANQTRPEYLNSKKFENVLIEMALAALQA